MAAGLGQRVFVGDWFALSSAGLWMKLSLLAVLSQSFSVRKGCDVQSPQLLAGDTKAAQTLLSFIAV